MSYYYRDNLVLARWRKPAEKGKWWLWPLLAVLLAGAVGSAIMLTQGPAKEAGEATVLVRVAFSDSEGGTASGVLISPKGHVLTNRHVVERDGRKARSVEVVLWSGTERNRAVTASVKEVSKGHDDLQNDWAVLEIASEKPLPYLRLSSTRNFQQGQTVYALGFPLGDTTATNKFGPQVKLVKGELTRVDKSDQGGCIRLTHSATLAQGMSGGPLIDGSRVIGINTAGLVPTESKDPNENYALPAYLLDEEVFKKYGF